MDRRNCLGALINRKLHAAFAFEPAAIVVFRRASCLYDESAAVWVIVELRAVFAATLFWAGLVKPSAAINIDHTPDFSTDLGGAFIVRWAEQGSIRVVQLDLDALTCFDAFVFRVPAKALQRRVGVHRPNGEEGLIRPIIFIYDLTHRPIVCVRRSYKCEGRKERGK